MQIKKRTSKQIDNIDRYKNRYKIYVCVENKIEIIEHILTAITGIGVQVSAASRDKSLFARTDSTTTILALKVQGFAEQTIKFVVSEIESAIQDYNFLGLVVVSPNGKESTWRAGNKVYENISSKHFVKNVISNKLPNNIDLDLLKKLVKSTCAISDVFFDITKEERESILLQLESAEKLYHQKLEGQLFRRAVH